MKSTLWLASIGIVVGLICSGCGAEAPGLAGSWHATIMSERYGPLEASLIISESDDGWIVKTNGADIAKAVQFGTNPADVQITDSLLTFTLAETNGVYAGDLTAPWNAGAIELSADGETLSGTIRDNFFFSGSVSLSRSESDPGALRDYPAIAKQVIEETGARIFDPALTRSEGFQTFATRLTTLAGMAAHDIDLLVGFHLASQALPFSHYDLKRSETPVAAMIDYFDQMEIGSPAAWVTFEDDVAVLTVQTMMGLDTMRYINEAYDAIAEKQAKALIIDLRTNDGGAFAVKPLVEHILDTPTEAGYFVANGWNAAHDSLPSVEHLASVDPWQSSSLKAFWGGLTEQGLLKIKYHPADANFDGPVFVLIGERTASAAEMAADTLRALDDVTLVGKASAGEMLSQSFFDLRDGYQLTVPIADYISIPHGRIEGVGVPVDVESDDALGTAMQLATEAIQ